MTAARLAIEGNLFAFFPLFARWSRAEAHDDPDMLWTLSDVPFPLFNSVLRARLPRAQADEAIERAIGRCRARGVPLLWWTGPSTEPADLDRRLAARGLYEEHAIGMTVALDAGVGNRLVRHSGPWGRDGGESGVGRPFDSAGPSASVAQGRRGSGAVTVERVGSRALLERWCEVLCGAFEMPAFVGEAFLGLTLALGLDEETPFRHYLARLDGDPVGTCSMFLGAGVAGVYDVGTLLHARRRGVASMATRAAMEDARRLGYATAILHSTDSGLGVYRSLGFREHCRLGQYVWVPT